MISKSELIEYTHNIEVWFEERSNHETYKFYFLSDQTWLVIELLNGGLINIIEDASNCKEYLA